MNNVQKNLIITHFVLGYNLLQYAVDQVREEVKGEKNEIELEECTE